MVPSGITWVCFLVGKLINLMLELEQVHVVHLMVGCL